MKFNMTPVAHDSEGNALYSAEQMEEVQLAARFEFALHQKYEKQFQEQFERANHLEGLLHEYCAAKRAEEDYRRQHVGPYEGEITEEVQAEWRSHLDPMMKRCVASIIAIEDHFRDEDGRMKL